MFRIIDLFDLRYGHSLELNRLTQCGPEGILFISRKMGDNGVAAYVQPIDGVQPNPSGELTCALSGNGVLSTFIPERPYYTAFHVACLRPLISLSTQELLYYCLCIKANRYRYNYGRQANRTLRNILIPELEEIPTWVNSVMIDVVQNLQLQVMQLLHEISDRSEAPKVKTPQQRATHNSLSLFEEVSDF